MIGFDFCQNVVQNEIFCIGQQSYGAFTKLPYVGVTPKWILMVWLVLIFVRIMCKMKYNDLSLSQYSDFLK